MEINKRENLCSEKISSLIELYPFAEAFFMDNGMDILDSEECVIKEFLKREKESESDNLCRELEKYIREMSELLGNNKRDEVSQITILPGRDKSGTVENFERLDIKKGEIISIVGPTGSGKSRLLADIEWIAQKDTPTMRSVLINNSESKREKRFSASEKLVAQISQNMNFVMDLTVYEFLELHAMSRLVENKTEIITKIIKSANELAGEKFDKNTQITDLSGGQSRALMIADTAILSKSPVILIDEIENAGIDRKQALDLLLKEEKIVIMSTHDPILALMAERRIVIKNGGIHKIISTTDKERKILKKLEELDRTILSYRAKLRQGKSLVN